MKVAVLQFPGSNCDQDALHGIQSLGVAADYVWHQEASLAGFEAVFVPGGFSYGDYLRCGAIAARSPIMAAVAEFAEAGGPVIGVCNGFQVLCEAGLLPGGLLLNRDQKFLCQGVWLKPESRLGFWMEGVDRLVRVPIAHGEGRYVCDAETLARLNGEGRVAFRYCDAEGRVTEEANVNGSMDSIAGVLNEKGNVLGMMPHPERALDDLLGGSDGRLLLSALVRVRA
ncbi:MAG: phosphoribosylformylglycinamidine synthase subunit PurQ [Fimbriimonadaceae bacterium]|nr:phosphoribosylformylglycinamidine synthase subunit PurQ [Fimbriimonadaceae bacterium]